jgi:hypothetical protein
MSGPEYFLPFVPLPEWAREGAPADFQAKVERYAAWRQSNDKRFGWERFGATPAEGEAIKEAAEAQHLLPQVSVGPLSDEDRRLIQKAVDDGQVESFPRDQGNYPDFTGHVVLDVQLPPELWQKSDAEQFRWLNEHVLAADGAQAKSFPWNHPSDVGTDSPPHGYTWHHHQQPGRMQLVPFGVHGAVQHSGGRQVWAGTEGR